MRILRFQVSMRRSVSSQTFQRDRLNQQSGRFLRIREARHNKRPDRHEPLNNDLTMNGLRLQNTERNGRKYEIRRSLPISVCQFQPAISSREAKYGNGSTKTGTNQCDPADSQFFSAKFYLFTELCKTITTIPEI